MTNPKISIEKSKDKKLKGNDVYIRSQLAYKEGVNRDHFIVFLNLKAYHYISRTWLLTQYPLLYNIRKGIYLNDEMDLDFFYLGTSLELTFKSILLQKGYLIHLVNSSQEKFKKMRKTQKTQPIEIVELFKSTSCEYNLIHEKNMITGLSGESIKFGILCNEEKYQKVINLEKDLFVLANYVRLRRNQVHLPGDVTNELVSKKINQFELYIKMVEFVNENIVDITNELIKKWNLNFIPIVKLERKI